LLFNLTPGLSVAGAEAILFLIWAAMVMKACSTLSAFLADVSRNSMPRLSANSYASQKMSSEVKRVKNSSKKNTRFAGVNETHWGGCYLM
jgi:hypothetical protein